MTKIDNSSSSSSSSNNNNSMNPSYNNLTTIIINNNRVDSINTYAGVTAFNYNNNGYNKKCGSIQERT